MRKKHWIELLPGAGRMIDNRAQLIKKLQEEIQNTRYRLAHLELQLRDLEDTCEKWVAKDWTPEEIEEAKLLAEQDEF